MSATISAPNFDSINIKAKSLLAADAAAAATTLTLQNVISIAANSILYFGNLDQGTTEKGRVQSIAGTVVTLTAGIAYPHVKFEDVTIANGDQIRFYRSSNVDGTVPADGNFSAIHTSDIVSNQLYTTYVDATGGSDYWYKFTYYNSIIAAETDIAQAVAVRGASYGHYTDVDAIRREAGLVDVTEITDGMISLQRDAAESLVNGFLMSSYSLPLAGPYPAIISKIVTILAAGYILSQEYSVLSPDLTTLGKAKINSAMDILTQISNRTLILTDSLGNSLLRANTMQGWPDDTTKDLGVDDAGGAVMFRISERF